MCGTVMPFSPSAGSTPTSAARLTAAARVTLAVGLLVTFLAAVEAQPYSGPSTGISYINPGRFPPPSDAWSLILEGEEVVYGPDMVNKRQQMEISFLNGTHIVEDPVGFTIRYTNWTAFPSQTPGLENYSAVVEHMAFYSTVATIPTSTLSATTIAYLSEQIIKYAALNGTVADGIIIHWVSPSGRPDSTNITQVDELDIKHTVKLEGYNLLPFHYDKQLLLMETVHNIFLADGLGIGNINISDWREAEAATNGSRKLLADTPQLQTLHLDIWTIVVPAGTVTPQYVWSNVSSPDSRLWQTTGALGVPMNLTFTNATVYSRPRGEKYAIVTTTSAEESGSTQQAPGSESGGSSLSTAAIAGIAVGVVVSIGILGLVVALVLIRRGWVRRGEPNPPPLPLKQWGSDFSKASDEDGSSPQHFEGAIHPSEITICKRPDGSDWLLGQGNFGQVYKAVRRGTTDVAVKKLNCYLVSDQLLHQMRREVAILRKVRFDKNIVQFYGACLPEPAMLCMEYMEGGDLRDALWNDKMSGGSQYLWHNKGKDVALAVARGLHFLHTSNVIHRDIKSSNILLTREGVAKVADVGLAITNEYFSTAGAACGTFAYAAPELLLGGMCTPKVDSYSYGVLLWEIVTREQPQRGQLRNIIVPDECPAEVEQLVRDCVTPDAKDRPSMKEVVERLRGLDGLDSASSAGGSSMRSGIGGSSMRGGGLLTYGSAEGAASAYGVTPQATEDGGSDCELGVPADGHDAIERAASG